MLHVLGLRAVGHSYGKRIVPCLQNRHTKRKLGRKELSGGYCQRFVCVAEIGIVAKKGLSQAILEMKADDGTGEFFMGHAEDLQGHTLTAYDPVQGSAFFVL